MFSIAERTPFCCCVKIGGVALSRRQIMEGLIFGWTLDARRSCATSQLTEQRMRFTWKEEGRTTTSSNNVKICTTIDQNHLLFTGTAFISDRFWLISYSNDSFVYSTNLPSTHHNTFHQHHAAPVTMDVGVQQR